MCEDEWIEDQREHQSIDRAPEMGGVADVVHVALGRPPAIQQIERREDVAVQCPGKAQDAHQAGDGYEDDGCHLSKLKKRRQCITVGGWPLHVVAGVFGQVADVGADFLVKDGFLPLIGRDFLIADGNVFFRGFEVLFGKERKVLDKGFHFLLGEVLGVAFYVDVRHN